MRTKEILEQEIAHHQQSIKKYTEQINTDSISAAEKAKIFQKIAVHEAELADCVVRSSELDVRTVQIQASQLTKLGKEEEEARQRAEAIAKVKSYIMKYDMFYNSKYTEVLTYTDDGYITSTTFSAFVEDMENFGYIPDIGANGRSIVRAGFGQVNRIKRDGMNGSTKETELSCPGYNDKFVRNILDMRKDKTNTYFHPFYPLLFLTLGGFVKEQYEYLFKFVLRKVDDVTRVFDAMPAVYSGGDVGWSIMYREFLPNLFGPGTVFTGNSDLTNGNFNGHFVNKFWVLTEEAVTDKSNKEKEKSTTQVHTLTIHEKGRTPREVENLISKMYSTNNPNGAIKVEGNSSDRRWCIWGILPEEITRADGSKINKHMTLALAVETKIGLDVVHADMKELWDKSQADIKLQNPSAVIMPYNSSDESAIINWIANGVKQFKDKKQMAAFVNFLYDNFSYCLADSKLVAIDTEYSRAQQNNAKSEWEEKVDQVLDDPDFVWISKHDLFTYAKNHIESSNANTYHIRFSSKNVETYITTKKCVTIEFRKIRVGKKSGIPAWVKVGEAGPFLSVKDKYFDSFGKNIDIGITQDSSDTETESESVSAIASLHKLLRNKHGDH